MSSHGSAIAAANAAAPDQTPASVTVQTANTSAETNQSVTASVSSQNGHATSK